MEIITNLEELTEASEPLKFLSETGIEKEEGNEIIEKLRTAMDSDTTILALAAPQIGINKRVFGIRFSDGIKFFLNPIITKKSNYRIAPETCASMPGKEILISRPEELTVIYHNAEYKYEENKLLEEVARIFDQQCQLLDGITPDVLGLVSDVELDGSLADLSAEEVQEIIEFYKNYIQTKQANIIEQVKTDPELEQLYKKLNFTEKVINGQITVVSEEDTEARKQAKHKAQKKVAFLDQAVARSEKAKNQAELKQFLGRKGKGYKHGKK